jgi:CBS domain-containing protein
MKRLQVQDWMTTNPITIDRKTNLSTAYHLMRLNNIRRLPVVNESDKLVGIVTMGDIREARPKEHATLGKVTPWELHILAATLEVKDFMTPDPVTVMPHTPIREAARLMLEHKIGGLPVVEEDHVVGILTESDLFQFIVEQIPSAERNLMQM